MTSPDKMNPRRFAVCVDSGDDDVDLDRWKIYEVLADPDAESHRQYRVVDESGEDYLYAQEHFRLIDLPAGIAELYSRAG